MPVRTNALMLLDDTIKTLSSDAFTATQTYHTVAAETGTADNLATISLDTSAFPTVDGAYTFRPFIVIRADTGDTITVKHGTGNIYLNGAADFALSGNKQLLLFFDGTNWTDLGITGGFGTIGGSSGSTDNRLIRADGTGGSTIQSSGITVDDSANMSGINTLGLVDAVELTIASGAITRTAGYHRIDTEGDASTDDLDTISGGTAGQKLILRAENTARTVVIRHAGGGTGNIRTYDTNSISLDETYKAVELIYDGTNWLVIGVTSSGGATTFNLAADSGTPETIANGNTMTVTGGTGIDTAVSATDTVTIAIDSTVATLTGSQTLTNKTLTTPTIGDLTNAQHNHTNAAGGGQLTDAALSAAVGVGKGGTGLTGTPTNGQLPIGNGTGYTLATLTQGSGVTITNGAGSITIAASGGSSLVDFCDFRLTLSSGVPIMTSNVTAATTLYCTPVNLPYTEGLITLKNGSTWETIASGEASVTLSGATASRPHDVFGYYNAGSLAIEILAWTNDTTRATAIDVEDGHPIKTGDASRRYIGTIRITGTTGQCEFSPFPSSAPGKLFVWNLKNQIVIPFRVIDTTNSWSYSTASWRQANASGNNQIEVIAGQIGSAIDITLINQALPNQPVGGGAIGEDSTSARATENIGISIGTVGLNIPNVTTFRKIVPLGYHYYARLEYGDGVGVTWYGDNNTPDTLQSGMMGGFAC